MLACDTTLSLAGDAVAEPCNTELVAELTAAAAEPRRAAVDGQEAESHPLRDRLELAKFLAANPTGGRRRGFKFLKVVPPGTVE
jgi:hypothetical protein